MLDWDKYSAVAERFQFKAQYQDREDLKHNIILALAEQRIRNSQNGNKPLTEPAMLRIASHTVADYYRDLRRNAKISLNTESDDGEGDTVELIDTIADDRAIDVEAWIDARVWLMGCPKRLSQIAHKRVNGIALEAKEQEYLRRFRLKSQKSLF
jgi:DNA-directed RNA polymerase specialized sigma24 family protein